MAGLFDVGSIAPPGADFASTGPHLHVGVYDASGKAVNPETARSFLLNRILVGKDKSPLYGQAKGNWQSNYPLTSQFGPRTAPTAGASTDHKGADFGIPQGTKLAWLANPGDVYNSDKGFGTIRTTDPQGNPYTVKLLHTTPGSVAQAPGQVPNQPTSQRQAAGNVYNIYFGGRKNNEDVDPSSDFLSNYLLGSLNFKPSFNPLEMVQNALFQTPNYLS